MAIVRSIFERYLSLGCVSKLQSELKTRSILSKRRVSRAGTQSGGRPYSRGALYSILQNRLYVGEIAHRSVVHRGEHAAIVGRETWDAVQARLRDTGKARRLGLAAKAPSLLAGLIYHQNGHRYTPLHATKSGKRYRYYVTQDVIRNRTRAASSMARLPAHELEKVVCRRLQTFLGSPDAVLTAAGARNEPGARQSILVRAAAAKARELVDMPPADQRSFLMTVVARITVNPGGVTIHVSRPACCPTGGKRSRRPGSPRQCAGKGGGPRPAVACDA